jgi:urea transporter
MAEPTIISWTPANWITVILMVALAFVVVGAVARIVQQRKANAGA